MHTWTHPKRCRIDPLTNLGSVAVRIGATRRGKYRSPCHARIVGLQLRIESFRRRETRTRSGVGKRRYIRLTPCRRSSDSNRGSDQEKGSKYNFHCRIANCSNGVRCVFGSPPRRSRSRLQPKPRGSSSRALMPSSGFIAYPAPTVAFRKDAADRKSLFSST